MLIFVKPAPGQLTAQCFQEHFHSVSSETEYIFLCLIIDPWPRAVAHSDPLSSGLNTNSTQFCPFCIFSLLRQSFLHKGYKITAYLPRSR